MRKINTASEFIKWLRKAAAEPTLYVMGCFGAPLNDKTKARYLSNHKYNRRPERQEMIRKATNGTYGFDCVCLIKGILWGWCGDPDDIYGGADYVVNDVPDLDAEQMMEVCKDLSSDFSDILPGEVVGMPGHIGVYVGDGLCIECTPSWANGVQYTACGNIGPVKGYPTRSWDRHGKLPYITYDTAPKPEPAPGPAPEEVPEHDRRYNSLEDVPGFANATITKMLKKGLLKGRADGSLDLSDDMVRIYYVIDKTGLFGD